MEKKKREMDRLIDWKVSFSSFLITNIEGYIKIFRGDSQLYYN